MDELKYKLAMFEYNLGDSKSGDSFLNQTILDGLKDRKFLRRFSFYVHHFIQNFHKYLTGAFFSKPTELSHHFFNLSGVSVPVPLLNLYLLVPLNLSEYRVLYLAFVSLTNKHSFKK